MLNLNHNKKKGNLNRPDRFFSPYQIDKNKSWVTYFVGRTVRTQASYPLLVSVN